MIKCVGGRLEKRRKRLILFSFDKIITANFQSIQSDFISIHQAKVSMILTIKSLQTSRHRRNGKNLGTLIVFCPDQNDNAVSYLMTSSFDDRQSPNGQIICKHISDCLARCLHKK